VISRFCGFVYPTTFASCVLFRHNMYVLL